MQWALTFFPSLSMNKVFSYVAMAPDYKGTIEGIFVDLTENLLEGGTRPSVLQQSTGSNYLKALQKHGGQSKTFVPTTNIYTYTDEVVEPEQIPSVATSFLPGAVNIPVQSICPTRVDDHFLIVTDTVTQYFVLQAFSSSNGLANPSTISVLQKTQLCLEFLPVFSGGGGAVEYGLADLATAISVAVVADAPKQSVEPPLFDYAK